MTATVDWERVEALLADSPALHQCRTYPESHDGCFRCSTIIVSLVGLRRRGYGL